MSSAPDLLRDLPVTLPEKLPDAITGIQHDSRRIEPGDLYVAIQGERFDGRAFVADAAERGAVAVLGAGKAPEGCPLPWIATDDPRTVLGPLAMRVYGRPADELAMIGVTGTNGKSTVVWLTRAMLDAAGVPCGRLGTMGYRFRDLDLPAARTTPEASDLHRILRRMRDAGAEAIAMEVSSHALRMGRVEGVEFDVAAFTNLTQDHLDFHADMEDYFQAKRLLFTEHRGEGTAVINIDDPWGRRLAEGRDHVLTFGAGGDVEAVSARLDLDGIRATVETPRGDVEITSPLRGSYNLTNLVTAVAIAEALEVPFEAVREGLAGSGVVPGRMEPVEAGQPFPAFVDYAHTDDALEHLLRAVRELTRSKIVLVFGCGGNRDTGKRFLMGRVAGRLADLPIVTSDNPRNEDPLAIIAAIEEGLKASGNDQYRILPDRRDAIRRAVAMADEDWVVVVAGKGNEIGQEIKGEVYPFSDREEIVQAIEERRGHAHDG